MSRRFCAFSHIKNRYVEHILHNKWHQHPQQLKVVSHLDAINKILKDNRGVDLLGGTGLYIHGGTGCGKTMLLDIFYENNCLKGEGMKCRFHFLTFMLDIHKRLHQHRLNKHKSRLLMESEPLSVVAAEFVKKNGKLVCLDEFQVTDVADAMILRTLFTAMWLEGVVLIATSNRDPDDLYLGGLNRAVFLPFISLLQSKCIVLSMSDTPDYRATHIISKTESNSLYFTPLNEDNRQRLHNIWLKYTAEGEVRSVELSVDQGRSITVPLACCLPPAQRHGRHLTTSTDSFIPSNICFFSFQELCCVPIGAADYLAIANKFDTIIIADIPFLSAAAAAAASVGDDVMPLPYSLEDRNTLRRFIVLIDVLYDAKVRLVCSAASPPCGLYNSNIVPKDLTEAGSDDDEHNAAAAIAATTEQFYLTQMNNYNNNYNNNNNNNVDNTLDIACDGSMIHDAASTTTEQFYFTQMNNNNNNNNNNIGNTLNMIAYDDSIISDSSVARTSVTTTEQFYSTYMQNNTSSSHGGNHSGGAAISVSGSGGSSGRSHTIIGDGHTEWSATGLTGVSMADLNPRQLEDEAFAFHRTISRLYEMQSVQYFIDSDTHPCLTDTGHTSEDV